MVPFILCELSDPRSLILTWNASRGKQPKSNIHVGLQCATVLLLLLYDY